MLVSAAGYAIANYQAGEQFTFDRLHYWTTVTILSLLWLAYAATLLEEPLIGLGLVGILLVASVMFATVSHWVTFRRTTKIIPLVTSYVSLSTTAILIFGFLYVLAGGLEWATATADETVTGNWIFYYSGLVYYSNPIGDIQPIGTARWVVLAESAVSVVFHVTIVAQAITRLGGSSTGKAA